MNRVAGIDCGTNSIRLLVADVERDENGVRLTDLTRQMRIVRLGQGVDKTGRFDPAAIDRTIDAVVEYERMISRLGASKVRFVATSASRDASNRDEFIDAVRSILGIEPEVVEGTLEAALSFSGAVSDLGAGVESPMLVVDIGGGSTELVLGDTEVRQAISVDMGAVRVTEKFFADCDPEAGIPLAHQERAIEWIDEQLDGAQKVVDLERVKTLVGVAGTVTTLTAQALGLATYQPELIHGASLSLDQIDQAVRFMVDQPTKVKAALGFMPEGREDVIAAGALIWSRIVKRVVARATEQGSVIDHVVTSEHDILDGIAISLA
ncbi:exopolyphosphatase [Actinomycetaceae bacterium UMB8039B]|uniref:Ppx/GppA phosphatase family protein n=1 Tax=unclassified Pauljensenia TaxID=2908895 RepID=UPI00254B05FF|nr:MULTISPECIES: exopolyphosphatase [unclassified Pauljensenia]MDK7781027.1 exopolyphosphatase [Actinomycetaceae bacterium UMB8041B]MDK8293723.1 exopolyphosphatase [Actinomycetaceae bacterium UMB8039B]MDK8608349.1 exopolyphosphatase [Actinomycetaceae bacterium UMB8041A]MDK8753567.1 exopolyphosphatase [Actinomycetaceae bacterium UMB8039A]MDK6830414.1 exopolyphosphatase [Pauljensenia sp. UMB8040A]